MNPPTYPIYRRFRSAAATNTPTAAKTTAGKVFALHATNRHSAAVFVKLYDTAAAGVTVGTTAPVNIFQVPAND